METEHVVLGIEPRALHELKLNMQYWGLNPEPCTCRQVSSATNYIPSLLFHFHFKARPRQTLNFLSSCLNLQNNWNYRSGKKLFCARHGDASF